MIVFYKIPLFVFINTALLRMKYSNKYLSPMPTMQQNCLIKKRFAKCLVYKLYLLCRHGQKVKTLRKFAL